MACPYAASGAREAFRAERLLVPSSGLHRVLICPMGCGQSSKRSAGAPRITGVEDESKDGGEREEKRQKAEKNLQAVEAARRHSQSLSSGVDASKGSDFAQASSRKSNKSAVSKALSASSAAGGRMSKSEFVNKASYNSQADFASIDQTIIIFDWDDTLCPSTWMRKHAQFDAEGHLKAKLDNETRHELQMLADQVTPLIEAAQELGKVIVVTNAKRPWVDTSCRNFLPSCKNTIKPIPVMYALELLKDLDQQKLDKDGACLLTETKARAMKEAVTNFYSRYPNQSWKNIISIGDAFFEHDAIRQVSRERPQIEGFQKKCRTKTVKLLEGPSIAGMVVQLSIIESWLAKIVQLDNDVDIDLSADEETVNSWVSQFGNDSGV